MPRDAVIIKISEAVLSSLPLHPGVDRVHFLEVATGSN